MLDTYTYVTRLLHQGGPCKQILKFSSVSGHPIRQTSRLFVCLFTFLAAGLPDWVARHTANFEYLFTGPALVQQSMYVSINVYH